jgi:DNA primase
MPNNWVDFKELRKGLDMAALLRHYGIEVKEKKPGQHVGLCPLPGHQGEKRPSFSVNLGRRIYHCFGCKSKGNAIELATRLEGLDPKKPEDLRLIALKLRDTFGVGGKPPKTARTTSPSPSKPTKAQQMVRVNAPLDFSLKRLDAKHPYLKGRGFSFRTMEHFGVGYCPIGLFGGRIAIPIHDDRYQLIGYAGRVIDDATITEDNPKYKLPPRRERNGVVYEFHKSEVVYNANRIRQPVHDLIVVEGFPSVWWLHQWGYPATVAVMGSDCSDTQARIITSRVAPSGRVWVLTDGDKAGYDCAASILTRLSSQRTVRRAVLTDGKQPTDCTPGDLEKLLWSV